jgi:hypothetical protein
MQKSLWGGEPVSALSFCRIWTVWMIIVPNLRWRTFRYWALRATNLHGIVMSPRRERVLTLTSQIKPPTSQTLTSCSPSSISHHLHHLSHQILVNVIPMCRTAVCSMQEKWKIKIKEWHVAAKPLSIIYIFLIFRSWLARSWCRPAHSS